MAFQVYVPSNNLPDNRFHATLTNNFEKDSKSNLEAPLIPLSIRTSNHLSYSLYCEDNVRAIDHLQSKGVSVKFIYLDPPYNTGRLRGARKNFRDTINKDWKDNIGRILNGAYELLDSTGFLAASINQIELFNLKAMLDAVFGSANFIGLFPVKIRHHERQLMINATFHDLYEYLLIYRKERTTRFFTKNKTARADKFIYHIRTYESEPDLRIINGKRVEIYRPNQYEIIQGDYTPEALRRYVIAGKIATANWSGEWYETHLKQLGHNLLIKVWGLENNGLGYRWFHTANESRKSGVYFQSQLNAGRPILPSNDLDYTEVVPTIYREGGLGCDFKDSKKPEALMRFLLDICTDVGDTVLDLYAGSGTTLAVAVKMNRSAIIVENDSTAIQVINTRVNNLKLGLDINCKKHSFTLNVIEGIIS